MVEADHPLADYLLLQSERDAILTEFAKYDAAFQSATSKIDDGYTLTNFSGEVCSAGVCASVDPIVALFFILADALAEELNRENSFGRNNDLVKFLRKPAGGDNSDFVRLRSLIVPQHDNGEIARLIRDPANRSLEIIQNARDKIIPPEDNGEIAKAIRDPIKCTVGHLWGGCD